MEEDICKQYMGQWANIQNIQRTLTTQYQKEDWFKNGLKRWMIVFPKNRYKWPTGTWKDAWYQANIRELQIKARVRYHFTSVRVVIIKMTTNKKCWWGCRGKRTLIYCWYECKLVQPLWKIVWSFLKKLIIALPYVQQSHFWIYIRMKWKQNLKQICTPMFIVALRTITKIWTQPKHPPMDEQMKTMRYIHIQ